MSRTTPRRWFWRKQGEVNADRLNQSMADLSQVVNAPARDAVTTVDAAYTVEFEDGLILADSTGGALTVTLPLAATMTGRVVTVKRVNGGGNNVTIARSGSDTLDGATSLTLSSQYQSYTLQSDGSAGWWIK